MPRHPPSLEPSLACRLVLCALVLAACVSRQDVTSGFVPCSPRDIEISDEHTSFGARTWVATCGGHRYHCSESEAGRGVWRQACAREDETLATSGSDAASSGSVAPVVGPRSAEDVREFLREINSPVLACTGGARIRFHLTIGDSGRITELSELPRALPPGQERCIRSLMSTVALAQASDARGVSATFAAVDPAPSATEATETSPGDAPFVGGPSEALDCAPAVRAHIDQRAARILVCVADAAVAVTASWDAGSTVSFGISGAADSTVVECVQAAIGAFGCPANAGAGHLLHPLAR